MERPYLFHASRRIGAYLSNARSGLLFTDHPAVLELNNSMSIHGVALGVRDLNDCRTGVVEALEELHDFFALRRVKITGGFVSQNELGILNHRAGHADELLLAAGKLIGEKVFLAVNVEAVEDVADQADALLVRNVFVRKRDFEVLEDGEIVDQVVALKDEADIGFVQLVAFCDVEFLHRLIAAIVFADPPAVQNLNETEHTALPRAAWHLED